MAFTEIYEVTMSFELDKRALTHLTDKSSYNHNYYHIDVARHGDYSLSEKCDTLYEECTDDDYGAYYSLGWFEGDRFVAAWTWYENAMKHFKLKKGN